jgi:hypothetical protein
VPAIERGFAFLGLHFSPAGLTVAKKTNHFPSGWVVSQFEFLRLIWKNIGSAISPQERFARIGFRPVLTGNSSILNFGYMFQHILPFCQIFASAFSMRGSQKGSHSFRCVPAATIRHQLYAATQFITTGSEWSNQGATQPWIRKRSPF